MSILKNTKMSMTAESKKRSVTDTLWCLPVEMLIASKNIVQMPKDRTLFFDKCQTTGVGGQVVFSVIVVSTKVGLKLWWGPCIV